MSPRVINPASLATPIGFAHGVLAGGAVYLGGQTAMGADGRIGDGDIVDQFRRALQNVLETLREAGGVPSDLVSVTIYLTDVDEYQRTRDAVGGIFAPRELLRVLKERNIAGALLEGGAVVYGSFLAAGAVQRLHLFQSTRLFGG